MNHKTEDHDEWNENKGKQKIRKKRGAEEGSIDLTQNKKKLNLNKKMKPALMTKCKLSDTEAVDLLNSANRGIGAEDTSMARNSHILSVYHLALSSPTLLYYLYDLHVY